MNLARELKIKIKKLRTSFLSVSQIPVRPMHQGKKLEANMWLISEFIEGKLLPIVGHNPFPVNEQSLMVAAVCQLMPSHIFEWGTNIGVSARIFYEACKFFQIKTEIHSVDLPDDQEHVEHPGRKRGILVRNLSEVRLHLGDGVQTALEILKNSDNIVNPLFFLDGDHSYESVRQELSLINESCPTANYLLHDAFFQTSESNYNIGPSLAVKEFLNHKGNEYSIKETTLGLPGMIFLYRKNLEI